MKRKYALSVITLLIILIVGCSNRNSENNSGKIDKNSSSSEKTAEKTSNENIVEKFSEENQKILSVKQYFDGYFNFFGTQTVMIYDEISEYTDGNHNIKRFYSKGSYKNKDGEMNKETLFNSPDNLFYKNMVTGAWEQVQNPGELQIRDRIDYKELALVLSDILKNEKYEMKETGNEYEVTITDKNFDFIRIFRKQFPLELNGVSQEQLSKNIVFSFNRDSYLLNRLNIELNFKEEDKLIEISIKMKFSDWNNIKPEDFEVIPKS